MKYLALCFMIIAMARPQSTHLYETEETEGVDIILTLDISGSMLAPDFKPNRITVAKSVIQEFIRHRKHDRIGLVVFSGESYTQSPLTTDYGIIAQFLGDIDVGLIRDGTAIGMAIATSLARLKDSVAKSRIIILLTDGENNQGRIDPITAAKMAATMDVKIYTIGIGQPTTNPIVFYLPGGYQLVTKMDVDTLKSIANESGGKYFFATNKNELEKIYTDIDRLEKSIITKHSFRRYREYFPYWVLAGLLLLVFEQSIRHIFARTLP